MEGLLTVAHWATENDEAVLDEPVHEGCVLVPALLAADRTRGVPGRAMDKPHREISHYRSVRTASDTLSAMVSEEVKPHPSVIAPVPGRL